MTVRVPLKTSIGNLLENYETGGHSNSTYLRMSEAASTYLTLNEASTTYLRADYIPELITGDETPRALVSKNGNLEWSEDLDALNRRFTAMYSSLARQFDEMAHSVSGLFDVRIFINSTSRPSSGYPHITVLSTLENQRYVHRGMYGRQVSDRGMYGAKDATEKTSTSQVIKSEPWGLQAYYTYWGRQYVYCKQPVSIACNYYTDDEGDLFVNGVHIASTSSCTATAVTINFVKGWNTIDLIYQEGEGGAGCWLDCGDLSSYGNGIWYAGSMKFPDFADTMWDGQ